MHCVREIRSTCEMRCGALGDLFHFTLRPKEAIFHNSRSELFHIRLGTNISLESALSQISPFLFYSVQLWVQTPVGKSASCVFSVLVKACFLHCNVVAADAKHRLSVDLQGSRSVKRYGYAFSLEDGHVVFLFYMLSLEYGREYRKRL